MKRRVLCGLRGDQTRISWRAAHSTLRPSALYLSSDLGGSSTDRGGYVELDYGVGGNVVGMTVHAQCADVAPNTCADLGGSNVSTRRTSLDANCACAREQHYQYLWDEANRLSEARRYDRSGASGSWTLQVRQHARYDGANQRTVKLTIDASPATGDPAGRVALWPFPGDFERRGLALDMGAYAADATLETESHYLVAGARVVWRTGSAITGLDPGHRVTTAIGDLLGTTTGVLDLRSGALIEHSTYNPNGSRETHLTTVAADVPTEPAGFTGKESDEEVAVVYFGERYLIPRLARWASSDPLAIHVLGGGESMNSYHYVSGGVFQAVDPLGLGRPDVGAGGSCSGEQCASEAKEYDEAYEARGSKLPNHALEPVHESDDVDVYQFGVMLGYVEGYSGGLLTAPEEPGLPGRQDYYDEGLYDGRAASLVGMLLAGRPRAAPRRVAPPPKAPGRTYQVGEPMEGGGYAGDGPGARRGGSPSDPPGGPRSITGPSKEPSTQAQKAIRTYEKRISEHEAKLAEFKANPTVRPGMENQPRNVIEAAQQARVRHLEREIQTFKDNIEKLRGGE